MSPATAFWVSLAAQGIAVVVFLLAETTAWSHRALKMAGAVLLLIGGTVAAGQAWLSPPALATNSFVTGAGFSAVAGIAVILTGLAVAADASEQARSSARGSLMAFAGIGGFLAVQAADIVIVIIALEVCAVSGFALVASKGTAASHEAAVKYLIQSSIATAALILGTAALAATGAVGAGYLTVNQMLSSTNLAPLVLGTVLVLSGLAFKSGAAPLHAWAPDAYEVAPPAGGAVLGGVVKAASLAALVTAVGALASGGASASAPLGLVGTRVFPLVAAFAVVSMIVGSTVALRQRTYLRLLGYAGVAQVGFALMGVASGRPGAAMLAIVTYAVAVVGAFVFAQAVWDTYPDWDGTVVGLRGVARRSPALGAVAVVIMMSLAGVPPLAGFWGKFEVLRTGITVALGLTVQGFAGLGAWYWIMVVVATISTMVSIAYYGSVVRSVFDPGPDELLHAPRAVSAAVVVSVVIAFVIFGFGVAAIVTPYATLFSGFGL